MSSGRGLWIRFASLGAMVAWPCLGQPLSYDAFSNPDGEIATEQQERASMALVRDPRQLELLFSDAQGGNVRATRVWQQLEATFSTAGVKVAEGVTRPGCLVPPYRELSGTCIPNWSFLDFLSQDRPGAAQLRKAIFSKFAARLRERELENRLILSAVNGLVAIGVAGAVLREADAAAQAVSAETEAIDPNRLNHIFGRSEHALEDFVRKSGGREQAFRRIQAAADKALRDGRLVTGPNGELPTGDAGNIIDVDGTMIRLIGGRAVNGKVRIATASRKGLP